MKKKESKGEAANNIKNVLVVESLGNKSRLNYSKAPAHFFKQNNVNKKDKSHENLK